MNPKQIENGKAVRVKIFSGITKLADVVSCTLGPRGRNVLLEQKWMGPTITNDGVTIANEVYLEDKFENMGAQMVKEVSRKANELAGDGTTTATVLAHAIIKEGMEYIENNKINPVLLKKGIDSAVKIVVQYLEETAKNVITREEIAQVATISSQDESIGELIADVFNKVGSNGVIQVNDSNTGETTIRTVEGLQFDRGYISPYMVTEPQKMRAVLEDIHILITDKKIKTMEEILPVMEDLNIKNIKQLLVIAQDVQQNALATMVVNKLKGAFTTVAVKVPEFGETRDAMLEDIAILTGGKVISEKNGDKLENVEIKDLGRAKRVIVTKEDTTIIEGAGDKKVIQERIEAIKREIEDKKTKVNKKSLEKLEERHGKLSGGIAIIEVGGMTEIELKERRYKTEDALCAARSAIEEGIVIGGGCALVQAAQMIKGEFKSKDECIGAEIVQRALTYPLRKIAENAGEDYEKISDELNKKWGKEEKNIGYDANAEIGSDDCFVDMFEVGIIDPKKVTRCAIENAASVAGMFLTTEAGIVEIPQEEKGNGATNAFI